MLCMTVSCIPYEFTAQNSSYALPLPLPADKAASHAINCYRRLNKKPNKIKIQGDSRRNVKSQRHCECFCECPCVYKYIVQHNTGILDIRTKLKQVRGRQCQIPSRKHNNNNNKNSQDKKRWSHQWGCACASTQCCQRNNANQSATCGTRAETSSSGLTPVVWFGSLESAFICSNDFYFHHQFWKQPRLRYGIINENARSCSFGHIVWEFLQEIQKKACFMFSKKAFHKPWWTQSHASDRLNVLRQWGSGGVLHRHEISKRCLFTLRCR